jgi:hypothetical protein
VINIESSTPPVSLPSDVSGTKARVLSGIKVLELCRIIAGPTVTRILAEWGADVLKVTSPNLSDVPFFQIDVNMGKHCTELDLKTPEGRAQFEILLKEADVVVDGYRPGAIEKLGYGPTALAKLALKRGKGYVYVNENCFGYEGEWAYRPGWQQIADCVCFRSPIPFPLSFSATRLIATQATGIAWAQGKFMGLNEPVIPPFPISDYGTGAMGAIAALTGLYHRTVSGGSWHGKVSLIQYDLLLFKVGLYSPEIQQQLRDRQDEDFFKLRHNNSVDQISATVLKALKKQSPNLFEEGKYREKWSSAKWKGDIQVVSPVASIEGIDVGFRRAGRPNGSDKAEWVFEDEDERLV